MKVEYSESALKQLKKLDKQFQKAIIQEMNLIATLENPRQKGKGLKSNLSGLWRYRVGDYRVICKIQDDKILITVLKVGHRRNIYDT
ncbi:MAG: type II toxin-antitoxin system RelE/ParE family toxin [Spirochaetaceae bacterium]|nr:type II toxin-antitoxin system RelE/ParE family toxin [Spirochaetaceae bacterium]MBQ1196978.1 type II toxin-antitoxin system RelE/ParE family toxin [Spirochaetaceae bacterium]